MLIKGTLHAKQTLKTSLPAESSEGATDEFTEQNWQFLSKYFSSLISPLFRIIWSGYTIRVSALDASLK